jgi:hypothetical protein
MGTVLLLLLILIVAAILAYAVYLLTLLVRAYLRLKQLTLQRDYEIMLYAALPSSSVDELVGLVPSDADLNILATVLERIATQNEGDLRRKSIELYRMMGIYDQRLREIEKGKPKKKALALQKLESLGLPTSVEGTEEAGPAAEGA